MTVQEKRDFHNICKYKNQHDICILVSKETSHPHWMINLVKTQPTNSKK